MAVNKPSGTQLLYYVESYGEGERSKTFWGEFVGPDIVRKTELDEVRQQITAGMQWKESVANFDAIATTYTAPQEGWVVSVNDTNLIYRYDAQSQQWINILGNVVIANASVTKDGLMSKEDYNWIRTFSIDKITETVQRKFVSQEQINKWENYVQFPGFGGNGTYYGIMEKAARSDHQHENLREIKNISFLDANGKISFKKIELYQDGNKLVFRNTQGSDWKQLWFDWTSMQAGVQNNNTTKTFLTNGDSVALSNIAFGANWVNKLSAPYAEPTWDNVQNKPSTFAPSAHNHTVSNLTDLHTTWADKLKQSFIHPAWNEVRNTPTEFNSSKHTHNRLRYINDDDRSKDVDNQFPEMVFTKQYANTAQVWCMALQFKKLEDSQLTRNWSLLFPNGGNVDRTSRENLMVVRTDVETNQSREDYLAMLGTVQNWTAYQDFLSGAGNSGSDMRFKTNIRGVGPILEQVNNLSIFSYDWVKEDENRSTFGVNADELLELGGIFESMVHERIDKDKTKWVEYDRFGVIALKCIQEQQLQIRALMNEIQELKGKLKTD